MSLRAPTLRFAILAAAGIGLAPGAGAQSRENAAAPNCDMTVVANARAALVRDGRTLVLDDGREVRLASIEVPAAETSSGMQVKAVLEGLIGGKMLTLKNTAATQDRYGRVVAYVFADGEKSIQNAMLSQGYAQVSAQAGACARGLLSTEKQARDNGRGLWSNADFSPLLAEQAALIAARKGHFALVEGKILSVREQGATIYINFGRRYTRDFTVTILKRNQRVFSAALGIDPKQLEGKRIRVRGVIEQRGGPIVEAATPEQIELTN